MKPVHVSVTPASDLAHHRLSVECNGVWYHRYFEPCVSANELLQLVAIELINIANMPEGGEQKYD